MVLARTVLAQSAVVAALICGAAASGFSQMSALPATPATGQGTAVAAGTGPRSGRRAEVVFSDGKLEVTANDSSLNQILREVSRATGMKITGGVVDERVYGKYGPAPASAVLANLLEGTGSNMLLRENAADADAPMELVLTPRMGGPSPPNPNAPGYDDDPSPPPFAAPLPDSAPPVANGPAQLPFSRPVPTPALTSTEATPQTPPPGGIVSAPTVAPATEPGTTPGPTTQSTGTSDTTSGTASPNGVPTPQQIYQQLQQLQQQQPAQPK
jgi:hypothetical protein